MMDSGIKISVVMPVHDTGRYLKEALDCVFSQTFKEFELICVDDCSGDETTISVLSKYNSDHDNMVLVRQEECSGPARARNIGLSLAVGKYVIFLDSDDLFSAKLLEKLWVAAEAQKAEVVIFNTTEAIDGRMSETVVKKGLSEDVFSLNDLGDDGLIECGLVPWNKLILREFLNNNSIIFQNLSSCNDVSFSCMVLLMSKRIYYLSTESLAFWRGNRPGQINMRRIPSNLFLAVMDVFEKRTWPEEYRQKLWCVLLRQGISELRQSVNFELSKEFYEKVSDRLKGNENIIFQNGLNNRLIKLYSKLPYESKWWEPDNIYKFQIKIFFDEIISAISDFGKAVLWGCGERGTALLSVAEENSLMFFGVLDKDGDKAEKTSSEYGVPILREEQLGDDVGYIIASNNSVYLYVKGKYPTLGVLNLEDYCAWY